MTQRGMTLAERQQARQQLIDYAVAAATSRASRAGRSITCGEYDRHDTCVAELPPNGGGCLCECHDPQPATTKSGGVK